MADIQGVPVEALLAVLEHGTHRLVAVMDEAGVIVFSNDAFRQIGYEPGEINGRTGIDFVHPDDVDRAISGISTLIESGISVPTSFRMRRADGGYEVFDVAGDLVRDAERVWMVVEFRPIPFHVITASTLGALARGEAAEVALARLAADITAIEPLDCTVGFALDGERGERLTVGPLASELLGVDAAAATGAAGAADPGDGSVPPWIQALRGRETVVCDDIGALEALAPAAHRRATGLGFVGATFAAVPDPGSATPALVALWYRSLVRKRFLDLYFDEFALDLARLALHGRHERRQLEHLARHDQLTGLANRSTFLGALDRALRRNQQADRASASLAVIALDLDDFKPVNDTHGHAAGDRLLEVVAGRFEQVVRPGDLVARLGGDEFSVLCPGIASSRDALEIAGRLVAAAAEPVRADGAVVRVGASAGVGFVAAGAEIGQRELLRRADEALYRAKRTGKGMVMVSAEPGAPLPGRPS